eukprot:TRINITY_DN46456_c0_g1_i1.p1 TRINITY_DN46456_c0_g1~~TRINITY_DN46456_c0_g1_i1.p1  ORF type:complete len:158 (+),score=8.49 TRINITY_DN46456_c0_g1_i1:85-558(+)
MKCTFKNQTYTTYTSGRNTTTTSPPFRCAKTSMPFNASNWTPVQKLVLPKRVNLPWGMAVSGYRNAYSLGAACTAFINLYTASGRLVYRGNSQGGNFNSLAFYPEPRVNLSAGIYYLDVSPGAYCAFGIPANKVVPQVGLIDYATPVRFTNIGCGSD